jgi:polyphosphate kinase 2
MSIDMESKISNAFLDLSKENIPNAKLKFEVALDEYKDLLIDLIISGHKGQINVSHQIKQLEEKVAPEILKELNLIEFLRIINNIVRMPKRKIALKIERRFEEYYDTLDQRFERLLDVIEKHKPIEYEDRTEDDKSVLSRDEYEDELYDLQIQLNRFQKWVVDNKKKVALVFEGRDAAGKGSAIKRFIQHMPNSGYRIVTMGIPTKEEMLGNNWFERYEKHMPKEGEIVLFDRSWYGMALVNPTMGYCTEEQYLYFMENVNEFEESLKEQGIDLIKFWFSITKEKQLLRFDIRKQSELKYWKFSPNDLKSIDKWDLFTKYKEQCFMKTATGKNPWVIVNSNDKKLARLNSIRYLLKKFNFTGKNREIIQPYPDIVYELR